MPYEHKTEMRFARLICFECIEMAEEYGHHGEDNGEKFLTRQQYDQQMDNPDKPWRCPDCKCYPCDFDDEYWELPIK